MALKINLSFKEDEIDLYKYIKCQRSPSNFIKDCVEFYRNFNNTGNISIDMNKNSNEEDINSEQISELLDF